MHTVGKLLEFEVSSPGLSTTFPFTHIIQPEYLGNNQHSRNPISSEPQRRPGQAWQKPTARNRYQGRFHYHRSHDGSTPFAALTALLVLLPESAVETLGEFGANLNVSMCL